MVVCLGDFPKNSKLLLLSIIPLMDKEHFIKLAGSQTELARLLGINQSAVSQWVKVPQARIWQLRVLRPEWFKVIDP
jgi:predicted XRE-type DNA-binding protein